MTNKQYEIKKRVIERKLKEQEMKRELRKLKWSWLPKFKMPTTSKLIVLVTFIICLQILWFSEHMVLVTNDTSYMYVLLGVPVSLIPVTLGYLNKSKHQNSSGGITYDIAMEELKHKYEMENNSNLHVDNVYQEDYTPPLSHNEVDDTDSVG